MTKITQVSLLIVLFITITFTLHLDRYHDNKQSQKHNRKISYECCKSRGGFECGNIVKECCKLPEGVTQQKALENSADYCHKEGFLGTSEYCPGDQIVQDCLYCAKVCEQKGGKLCGWQNAGEEQCCLESDCTGDISLKLQSCKTGTTFDVKGCIRDLDTADGFLQSFAELVTIEDKKDAEVNPEDKTQEKPETQPQQNTDNNDDENTNQDQKQSDNEENNQKTQEQAKDE